MRRRKSKLVRLDMQIKVVLVTLFVACLALVINFQLNLVGVWGLKDRLPPNATASDALEGLRLLFVSKLVVAAIITVPLSAAVGIAYSFKFAGPIYRFKRYFGDMISGRWDQHVSLRRGDDLQDLSAAINEAMDQVRARLKEHQELFADLEDLLPEPGREAGTAGKDRIVQVRQRMASERAAFSARFPTVVSSKLTPVSRSSSEGETQSEHAPTVVSV